MADLTTVDGAQITFKPDAVVAVTDHDANTGVAETCVYGITKGVLHIAEPVIGFLQRIGVTANFAQLTRPNGSPIWINGASVSSLRAPQPDEYVAGVNTIISAGSLTQGVTETPATAKAAINVHGGKL